MASKKPKEYMAFEDAQILWELDFPSKPELLESLLKERLQVKLAKDTAEMREKEINNSLLAFLKNNRIDGVVYEGVTYSKKVGAAVTVNKEALMKAGVSAEVIEACVVKTPWEALECRAGKEKVKE